MVAAFKILDLTLRSGFVGEKNMHNHIALHVRLGRLCKQGAAQWPPAEAAFLHKELMTLQDAVLGEQDREAADRREAVLDGLRWRA